MIGKSKKIEIITYYWACNNPDHRHSDEVTADKCILRMADQKARPAPRRWTEDGLAGLIEKHNSGMSYALIGRSLGIGGHQIKHLITKAYQILKQKDSLGESGMRIFEIVNELDMPVDIIAHFTQEGAEEWLSTIKKKKKYEGMLNKLKIKKI